MGRVDRKVAIVTGGASGIGRATSLLLATEGASVVVADLDAVRAKSVVAEIEAGGGRGLAVAADVGDESSVRAVVQAAVDAFGALHIVFNNAADTSLEAMLRDGMVADMDTATWDHAMAVDLRGAMLGCKHAIPHLIAAGGGSIVNTASNQGILGDLSQTAYSAAKAGVIMLTKSVATQYGAQGVRCNAVSPGAVRTPALERACPPEVIAEIGTHSAIPRVGEPEDLARAVLFLASDDAAYITGQVLPVDGGQMAHLPHFSWLVKQGAATTLQA